MLSGATAAKATGTYNENVDGNRWQGLHGLVSYRLPNFNPIS